MRIQELPNRIRARVETAGVRGAARSLARDAFTRVADLNREIILMALDLREATARAAGKVPPELTLHDLDDETHPRLIEMLAGSEPWRIEIVEARRARGVPGFVALEGGRAVGFVHYATAHDRAPHPDLAWLGIALEPTDVYTFDIFVPENLRGRGIAILRLMYARLHQLGYQRARGYVYAWKTPALFSYRSTGWRETGRLHEHRFAERWVLVGGGLYRLHPFHRSRVAGVPSAVARWIEAHGPERTSAAGPGT